MHNNSSNNEHVKSYTENLKSEKENIICKDGFCTIPNQHKESKIDKNDINIFEPI